MMIDFSEIFPKIAEAKCMSSGAGSASEVGGYVAQTRLQPEMNMRKKPRISMLCWETWNCPSEFDNLS